MKKIKSFTIIEMLVAMLIFTLIIGGSIVLMQQTLVMISLANQRLVAYYLAQEGIELARNVRDNNWLQQPSDITYPWDAGFFSLGTPDLEIDYNDLYSKNKNVSSFYSYAGKYFYLDNNGYTYNTPCSSASANNCTSFKRRINVSDEADGSILIECYVEWRERGREHSVMIQDKLYNWYGIQ